MGNIVCCDSPDVVKPSMPTQDFSYEEWLQLVADLKEGVTKYCNPRDRKKLLVLIDNNEKMIDFAGP